MVLKGEGLMISYNKPKLVAFSTYIWCCVLLYAGKYTVFFDR
jgi:hypothetical protein